MISGMILKHKKSTVCSALFTYIFLAFSIASSLTSRAYANELETLLLPFTTIQSIKLPFQEQRHSLFLKKPKEYKGTIEYTRPDIFIKEITWPVYNKFIIENNHLTILSHKPDHTKKQIVQSVSLNDFPQFKQIKALFSGLLQGKAEKLMQYYHYEINELEDNKTQLILKSRTVDAFIQTQQVISQHIEVIFTKDNKSIKHMSIRGFGGEQSIYSFATPIHIKRGSE